METKLLKGKNRHYIIGMGNSAMIWYIEASYTK